MKTTCVALVITQFQSLNHHIRSSLTSIMYHQGNLDLHTYPKISSHARVLPWSQILKFGEKSNLFCLFLNYLKAFTLSRVKHVSHYLSCLFRQSNKIKIPKECPVAPYGAHRSKITKKVHKPPRNHYIEWLVFSDISLNCESQGEKGRTCKKYKIPIGS